ncbi:DNA cytosine methyltransferase [Enterococcus faecalis]|uniref:DNA (cytosine-5-)-methyltransferase n=1 Tax=Enterococcus faecalis TaxID=1351 RepID=UPI0013D791AF|nr:DNA cytosine methyltransferase [Enterococcus faecalis]NFA63724.1 DNA cytosine methyltransferase [Enterococcus faecalis]HAP3019617.1 DNA cytosine methyltransferase [Enterococcus faecalis]
MDFLDLFAGIGGFRLGMEMAGHRCIGFCEIDKYARKSYKAIHNTKGEIELHDITRVSNEFIQSIGHTDIICGGFPCQTFSVAGKRQGFADTRGTLFFEIARFAAILRPRLLFLENVKGLLNHQGGATFETILRTLDELGYDVEWECINSKAYVPQNRERIFIIGHSREERSKQVFPLTRENQSIVCEKKDIIVVGQLPEKYHQSSRVFSTDSISPTLTTKVESPKILVRKANKILEEVVPGDSINLAYPHSKTRRGRVGKQVAHTLLTGDNQAVITENYQIRKLTPRECWRLQGFPDWAFECAAKINSDTQLYKQAGNSVTVPVIFDIARHLN